MWQLFDGSLAWCIFHTTKVSGGETRERTYTVIGNLPSQTESFAARQEHGITWSDFKWEKAEKEVSYFVGGGRWTPPLSRTHSSPPLHFPLPFQYAIFHSYGLSRLSPGRMIKNWQRDRDLAVQRTLLHRIRSLASAYCEAMDRNYPGAGFGDLGAGAGWSYERSAKAR